MDVVDHVVAVAGQADQPVQHAAAVIERTADVEGGLLQAVVADLQLHFLQRVGVRPLADEVDQAARRHRTGSRRDSPVQVPSTVARPSR
ncbi:hypothetical protein G6F32_015761 [Rhizopus arrhizus]|nr:hypothetical protein G6F32_015761 [Rhizopus arrhizus]